ncbi:MAG: hypothetical protein OCD03_16325 [Hyphomicrobiales bacterium]
MPKKPVKTYGAPLKKPTGNYSRPHKRGEKKPKMASEHRLAMFMFLIVGGLIGYSANRLVETTFGKTTRDINELAVQAHEVYASVKNIEQNRVVELESIDKQKIENWFNFIVKTAFKVPDLQEFNFEFVGARLTVAEGKPAAYLLYINDDDQRIAYYMARSKSNSSAEILATQTQKWNLSTWHDDSFGHVLIGSLKPAQLTKILTSFRPK